MLIKLTSSSNIFNFPNEDYGAEEIKKYINQLTVDMRPKDYGNWSLIFRLNFAKSNWIGVYKRGITYPATKEKDVSIVIPVPTLDQAKYGLKQQAFAPRPPLDPSKFWTSAVEYESFDNMRSFIIDSAKRGVHLAFKNGISINKQKIRLDEN